MKKTIYALGFFDGVHLGHQALLHACCQLAQKEDCHQAVATFCDHPEALLRGQAPARISSDRDRRDLLFSYGIPMVMTQPFNRNLMQTPWEDYLLSFKNAQFKNAGGFVCGSDFRFGAGGAGTAEKLAAWCAAEGLVCAIVPQQTLDGIRISSTHIRNLLETGNISEANRFLGHPHRMTGKVIHGKGLGHTLGIPTANMLVPEGTVSLPRGVYACQAMVSGVLYPAVTNIGLQPTVDGDTLTVESWLLDFEGDLYDKELTLLFHDFLRPEQKFPGLAELQAEIRKNAGQTRKILEKS